MKKTFNDYLLGFKYYIPVIILTILMRVLDEKLGVAIVDKENVIKKLLGYINIWSLIDIIVAIFLSCYATLISKKVVKMETINQIQCIKEALKLYFKVLVMTVLVIIMFIPVFIIGMLAIRFGVIVTVLYFTMLIGIVVYIYCLIPIGIYYKDMKIIDCFKYSLKIIDKYGFQILGFTICFGIITSLINMPITFMVKAWEISSILSITKDVILMNIPIIYTINILNHNENNNIEAVKAI